MTPWNRYNIWSEVRQAAIDLSCRVREANVARIAILWTAIWSRCAIDLLRRVRGANVARNAIGPPAKKLQTPGRDTSTDHRYMHVPEIHTPARDTDTSQRYKAPARDTSTGQINARCRFQGEKLNGRTTQDRSQTIKDNRQRSRREYIPTANDRTTYLTDRKAKRLPNHFRSTGV